MYKVSLKIPVEDFQAYNMGESVSSEAYKDWTVWIPKQESQYKYIDVLGDIHLKECPLYSADGTNLSEKNAESGSVYAYGIRMTPILTWPGQVWGQGEPITMYLSGISRGFGETRYWNAISENIFEHMGTFTFQATGLPSTEGNDDNMPDLAYHLEQNIDWSNYAITEDELYFSNTVYNGHYTTNGPPEYPKDNDRLISILDPDNYIFTSYYPKQIQDETGTLTHYLIEFTLNLENRTNGIALGPMGNVYYYFADQQYNYTTYGFVVQHRWYKVDLPS